MQKFFIFLFLAVILPSPAFGLTTSEHALRVEDRKEGNALLGAESAVIEKGEIYHTIVLLWGKLDIYGEVDEVVVLSGHVVFHEGAKLDKSIVVMGGSFESQPGANIAAENVVMKVPGPAWRMLRSAGNLWRENIDWVTKLLGGIVFCVLFWLLGWAIFRGFPALQKNTEGRLMKEGVQNLVIGFVGSMAACVVFVLLLISIVGILLIPFYFLSLVCMGVISYLAAALWTGHRLLPPKEGQRIRPLGFLLGLLALQFLWVVPVWWASLPVLFLWTLGWGALLRGFRLLWR